MSTIIDGTAGMTAPVGAVYNGLATLTAQTSTSGTSIDFTGIPLWVKRVTVMFSGVSGSGTSNFLIQLGSGSITTSGYASAASTQSGTQATSSAGFLITVAIAASDVHSGMAIITNLSGNIWSMSSMLGVTSNGNRYSGGTVTLSGTLDRVRITTVGGTDTFDAGTINVMYE